jgi:hypothetical protein
MYMGYFYQYLPCKKLNLRKILKIYLWTDSVIVIISQLHVNINIFCEN